MPHDTPLITTIVFGLSLAFVLGAIAHRFRLPPLVGYLLAGVLVGPYTPGFIADRQLAPELAELGVILLMFGVGLHFSLKDLLSVRRIAVPGALLQIIVITLLGLGLGMLLGWPVTAGLIFGLALSVASTVVLLRALQERRIVDTERGRIAVGWLIVEDLAMVLALVLLPALANIINGGDSQVYTDPIVAKLNLGVMGALGFTLLKLAGFLGFMLVVGRRVIPWILHEMAHTGSRELFRLAVLVIALGCAFGAAELFGVSLALGAFFAGMILSESQLSQRAAQESLPLRDAFAVLFFVSVGMLFNPGNLIDDPLPILATLFIIIVAKAVVSYVIVRVFKYSKTTALTIAAGRSQIGEFSFILAALGIQLKLLPEQARDLILAGAILSMMLNPLVFAISDYLSKRKGDPDMAAASVTPKEILQKTKLRDHTVLVGYGRVGSLIGPALRFAHIPFMVIEDTNETVTSLHAEGIEVIAGNAVRPEVLQAANLAHAERLIVAIPDAFEAGQVVEQARAANAGLEIIVRSHSDAEVDYLRRLGANNVIMGEREIASAIIAHILKKNDAEDEGTLLS
ncbi:MAG: YbaL family putative K(+) efflux transporter [Pseudomonadota bacterium]